jgi:hypothetical protein
MMFAEGSKIATACEMPKIKVDFHREDKMSQMTGFNLTKASDRFASHHFPRNH